MSDWYRLAGDGSISLTLHIQPGAKKTEFAGLHGDALKIRLPAPPVDGKANAELVALLADHFACRRADIAIKAGAGGRMKLVTIRER